MATVSADRAAAIRAAVEPFVPTVVDLAARIAAVPAPTGDEGDRSQLVAGLFRNAGVDELTVDELGDVVATVRGKDCVTPAVLLAAHLDTVFPASTPLTVRRDGDRLFGPGVGDNSLGVAAVVILPEILRALDVRPAVDLLLTGNVGEEGLGNLRGMRAVMEAHPRVGAAIAIEGHNLGRVTHVAVGSRRLRVVVRGPGGHSWGDYGRPSAVHALGKLIADLATVPLPTNPKTTFNVGLIEGGVSVNTIAPTASCVVDLRSTDPASLRRLADRVDQTVAEMQDGVTATVEVLGERPAGVVPADSPIVSRALQTLRVLGIDPACDASSTDANVPIGRGLPAVCIGLTHGANAHREDEYIESGPLATGLAQLVLLALGLADDLAAGEVASSTQTEIAVR